MERLLGRGPVADVWLGHVLGDEGFRRPVAIRRVSPHRARDPRFVDRLSRSVNRLVGVHHGNLVGVLDLSREGDEVLVVMELVDGPTARQLLDQSRGVPLPLSLCAYIIQSVAEGLAYAHSRSIVHGNLSPSNVLISSSGEVRVADFSIDSQAPPMPRDPKLAYMAPEHVRGNGTTARSDVFALGTMFYELITGTHPFVSPLSRGAPLVPPSRLRSGIPASLDAICAHALAHRPEHRYEHMQQLIDAIIDARFGHRWHDGASALAAYLRRISVEAHGSPLETLATAHPITLAPPEPSLTQIVTTVRPRIAAPLPGAEHASVTAPLPGAEHAPVVAPSPRPMVIAAPRAVTAAPQHVVPRRRPPSRHPSVLGHVYGGAAGANGTGELPVVISRWWYAALGILAFLVAVIATLAVRSAGPDDSPLPPPQVTVPDR